MSCFSAKKTAPKKDQVHVAPPKTPKTPKGKGKDPFAEDSDDALLAKMPHGMWLIRDGQLFRCKFCKENDPENPLARGSDHITNLSCTLHVHKNDVHKKAEDEFVAVAYQEIIESLECVAGHLNNFKNCFKAQDYDIAQYMKVTEKNVAPAVKNELLKTLLDEVRVCFKSAGRQLVEQPRGTGIWQWKTATCTQNFLKFAAFVLGQEYVNEEGLVIAMMRNGQQFGTIVEPKKWEEYKAADQGFKVNIVALIKGLELLKEAAGPGPHAPAGAS